MKIKLRVDPYDYVWTHLQYSPAAAIRRYYKHRDGCPLTEDDIDALNEAICASVMSDLCEVIEFNPELEGV